jgi:hypothetical protein
LNRTKQKTVLCLQLYYTLLQPSNLVFRGKDAFLPRDGGLVAAAFHFPVFLLLPIGTNFRTVRPNKKIMPTSPRVSVTRNQSADPAGARHHPVVEMHPTAGLSSRPNVTCRNM